MGDTESKPNPNWTVNEKAWSQHQNIDMCGQGDVEIIHNWRNKYTIDDLKKIVEEKGYSAISVGSFGHAALKKFSYQLESYHCAPTKGYTNVIHIFDRNLATQRREEFSKPFRNKLLKLTTGEFICALHSNNKKWTCWEYVELCVTSDLQKRALVCSYDGEFLTDIEPMRNVEFALDISFWKYKKGNATNMVRHENGTCKQPGGGRSFYFDPSGLIYVKNKELVLGRNEKNRLVLTGPTDSNALKLDLQFFENQSEADLKFRNSQYTEQVKTTKNESSVWKEYQNIDMCGQGDVEIIHDWRKKYSIDDLKRVVEEKNYSAVCVGSFGHAALKKFDFQLDSSHCKPSRGYTNSIYIFTPSNQRSRIFEERPVIENSPGWSEHKNMDMCGQGDVEFIQNWRNTHTIESLRKYAEEKGYSAISVGGFPFAAFKKFDYHLTIDHCKPSKGYTNSIHIFTPSEKQKFRLEEKRVQERRKNQVQGWEEYENMDMCGQGDVEFIGNWRSKHSVDDLKRIAEEKGYSAFSIGGFDFCAFKKFDYQLTVDHCKPSRGYKNSIWIFNLDMKKEFQNDNNTHNNTQNFSNTGDKTADIPPPPYAPN